MSVETEPPIQITIDGITYQREETTFDQDSFITEQVVQAGLSSTDLKLNEDGSNLEDKAMEMVVRAYQSGALFKLLAGLLVEEGTEWSREHALIVAERIRKTKDRKGKEMMYPVLVGAVMAFFVKGDRFDVNSLASLLPNEPEEEIAHRRQITPEEAGRIFRSGLGNRSS